MPTLLLRKVQYDPSTGTVALLLEHDFGAVFANTSEEALAGHTSTPGANWGNDEALIEAQAILDDVDGQFGAARPAGAPLLAGKGYVVTLPPAPAPPAPPADAPAGV